MRKVMEYIERHHMIQDGDKIIVGVSGGADSICLLFVLKEYQKSHDIALEAVHVEHGIRGTESLEDAAFTERLCREWLVPFHLFERDVGSMAIEQKLSVEEAGRKVRYEAFEEVMGAVNGTKTAVAHNANDQAETILWNLIRGSGITGIGGILPVNGSIIRPLLGTAREDIEACLNHHGIPYRTDRTNLEETYTRNKLRLNVLPYLEQELNLQAVQHITRTGECMQRAERYLEKQAEKCAERIAELAEGGVRITRHLFLEEEDIIQEYVLRWSLRQRKRGLRDISQTHIRDMRRLAARDSYGELHLPGGIRVVSDQKELWVSFGTRSAQKHIQPTELVIPGETLWGKYRIITSLEDYKNQIITEKKYTKWFDYDTIINTVQLRSRETGDFFILDSSGSHKKLKNYFIDEKVSRQEREEVLLLAEGSHILWAVGYRISGAYKITEKTKTIIKVQVMEVEDGRQDSCVVIRGGGK